jgi:hypothetical protein
MIVRGIEKRRWVEYCPYITRVTLSDPRQKNCS